jgi:hypothetical protein
LINLFPCEILVVSDIRYSREYCCEVTAAWAAQGRAQYLAVLLLGTAIVFGCALLQRFNQIFWQISNHQLSHDQSPPSQYDSNASARDVGLQAMQALFPEPYVRGVFSPVFGPPAPW